MATETTAGPDGDDGTVAWSALSAETVARLTHADVANAASEARWIVEAASGMSPAELAAAPETPATVGGVARLDTMVARRAAGEPLQYVLGRWAFRTLDLMVDGRVLIPRPETEQLVDIALEAVDRLRARRADAVSVVDLGTGSGAVGLAVAVERESTRVVLTDVDESAVAVARANLTGLGRPATRVEIRSGSWFEALDPATRGGLDVVVSNPPYVPDDEVLDPVVEDHEPHRALRGGPDGLDAAREILTAAPRWLAPDGAVVLELGDGQLATAVRLAESAGFSAVEVRRDLAGRDRFLYATAPRP
ncbi:MAG: peptide chain release factor N(5)-glutamine methyltransferase [Acidimicrobiales bacterium]